MTELSDLFTQIEQLSAEGQARVAEYVAFWRWREAQGQLAQRQSWSFSFIEAFKEAAVLATDEPAGLDVQMGPAVVGGERRPALWAHPPVVGQAVIEYHVPVPQQVHHLQLRLAIGIRDGAKIAPDNLVAFGVRVNGVRVWGRQTNELAWQEVSLPLDLVSGDMNRFEFTTEALASHEWTWAVWGAPELVGIG
jgi:hypothetical protein